MNFDPLRKIMISAAILGFVLLHLYFLLEIVRAADAAPPNLGTGLVAAAAALSGVLGSAFAVALGVETKQESLSAAQALSMPKTNTILKIGIYAFAFIGLLTLIVYLTNTGETPGSISSLALLFLGYLAALLTNAYKVALPQT